LAEKLTGIQLLKRIPLPFMENMYSSPGLQEPSFGSNLNYDIKKTLTYM
jgi:hypothetical protein